MKHLIRTPDDLALALRAVRKSAGLRQDDLAGAVGVSRQFAVDVEKGKPTVQLGKVLQLLAELGIALSVDIPDDAGPTLDRLKLEPRPRAAARPKPRAVPRAS
jgi:y4mF family transcriptional regulator